MMVAMDDDVRRELDDLRRRVGVSEAVLAIQSLKARYGGLVDRRFSRGRVVGPDELDRLATEIADLFTPDGEWDGGPVLGTAVGREAIADRMRQPTLTFSRHLFLMPRVTVDGDRASARWDLLSPCRAADGTSYWMCGFEDDTYERSDDGTWRHRTMRMTTVFLSPTDPGWERIFH